MLYFVVYDVIKVSQFVNLLSAFMFSWSYWVTSGKHKILAAVTKLAIEQLYEKKKIQTDIASLLDSNRSVVSRVISRYRRCGSAENRPRTGRPPSCRLGRSGYCSGMSKNLELRLYGAITNTFNKGRPRWVSQRTIRCAVREEGYQRRVIRKAIRLCAPTEETDWPGAQAIAPACNWVLGQSCI